MPTDQERITQLENQQAMLTEAVRRIVEGRFEGAGGAAGIYVALVGGTPPPDFKPVPFVEGA